MSLGGRIQPKVEQLRAEPARAALQVDRGEIPGLRIGCDKGVEDPALEGGIGPNRYTSYLERMGA